MVNAFLRGEYTMDEEFQELVKKGKKTQEEVDSMIQLANEVQYAILTKKLKPGLFHVIHIPSSDLYFASYANLL